MEPSSYQRGSDYLANPQELLGTGACGASRSISGYIIA